MAKFSGLKQYSFLCSLCSNLGRACLHPMWHLLALGSPRWWIPFHAWCPGHLPPGGLSTWHTWAFSQLWLVSRGAQSWGCQGFLRLTPWTGSVISTRFCRPEASHRPAQIQGVGGGVGIVQGVNTGKSGLLGHQGTLPHEPSLFLKGKKKDNFFILFVFYCLILLTYSFCNAVVYFFFF